MEPTLIQEYSSTAVGFVVPILVQLIRAKLLPWSKEAAQLLSLFVSAVCVSIAYLVVSPAPTWEGAIANLTGAFTLSQLVYRRIEDNLKSKLGTG